MRVDRRGRRIGANPWREYVMDVYSPARTAWEMRAEIESKGYDTELAEYRELHPGPTLKATLVGLAGTWATAATAA